MKIPVALVTGFLGSGKTTLLSRLLAHPDMGETAVIVNELGEVGIDHHLLRRVDERTVLLPSGCVCCALRGDLADELRDLLARRDARRDPALPPRRRRDDRARRPGADPLHAPLGAARQAPLRLEGVVTTVDAQHGLRRRTESVQQAAAADRLVVTKTDLAEPGSRGRASCARLNPGAPIARGRRSATSRPPRCSAAASATRATSTTTVGRRTRTRRARCCLDFDEQLDWTAFGIWLTMLLQARGEDVLRVKGLLERRRLRGRSC